MKNYFEKPTETETRWCAACARETVHDRTVDGVALWTCRDPKHVHPTRHEQVTPRMHVARVVPRIIDETDYFRACDERDYYIRRCTELEKKLNDIHRLSDGIH
jgi:hypothetical protein